MGFGCYTHTGGSLFVVVCTQNVYLGPGCLAFLLQLAILDSCILQPPLIVMFLLPFPLQFTYSVSKAQLKMLQVTSNQAQQTVTIQCRNVGTSSNPASFTGFRRGVRLHPNTLSNGCEVMRFMTCIFIYLYPKILCR